MVRHGSAFYYLIQNKLHLLRIPVPYYHTNTIDKLYLHPNSIPVSNIHVLCGCDVYLLFCVKKHQLIFRIPIFGHFNFWISCLWMSLKMLSKQLSVYAVKIINLGWKGLPNSMNTIFDSCLSDSSSSWYDVVLFCSTICYKINFIY